MLTGKMQAESIMDDHGLRVTINDILKKTENRDEWMESISVRCAVNPRIQKNWEEEEKEEEEEDNDDGDDEEEEEDDDDDALMSIVCYYCQM